MTTKKLSRNVGHRKLLIRNLLCQLYIHESIITTKAKAAAIQPFADRMIQQAKTGDVAVRRHLRSSLVDPMAVSKLVDTIAPSNSAFSSGFTRIIKLGRRTGDNALMAKLELVNKTPKPSTDTKTKNVTTVKEPTDSTDDVAVTKEQTKLSESVTQSKAAKKSVAKKPTAKSKVKANKTKTQGK